MAMNNDLKQPEISVVTVVYNAVETIERTIKSVLSQREANYEYLIIDGSSKDGTIELIRSYEKYLSCWVSEPDSGIYDAMNKGIRLARGRIVHLLNADDYYCHDSVLFEVGDSFKKDKNIDLLSTAVIYRMANGKSKLMLADERHLSATIPHTGLFVRKEVYRRKPFNIYYRYASDQEFILHVAKNFNIAVSRKPSVVMASGGLGNKYASQLEAYKIHWRHGEYVHQNPL